MESITPHSNTDLIRISKEELITEFDNLSNKKTSYSKNLNIVLESNKKLKLIKSKEIKFSEPVLKQGENAVIFPHTINVIQGQAGVHKSRLAEALCSAFMKLHNCENEILGFRRNNFDANHTVVYVDTERNLSEQLPFALQSIQLNAGYGIEDHPHNFEYISLLQIDRKDRFETLNEYLENLRVTNNNPLFIVLDVSTDCIEDFNKTDKSMELIDLMNKAINEHDVIFLCLIHENPKSEKARGHFGTELMNKASTVIQVSFEKDASQNDTDIIKVKYLKCRSTARHTPFHIKFCNKIKGLIIASKGDVSEVINNRKHKAGNEEMKEHIKMYLGDGTKLTRSELLDKLTVDFQASMKTIETRIKTIMDEDNEFEDDNGNMCQLFKQIIGKVVHYTLKTLNT